ncbi:MAG: riboflavin kinase [Rikenellaceae bacterium]
MVIEGVVTQGRKLGRELGFPTVNVAVDSAFAGRGIYRSVVTVEGIVDGVFDAVTNIGVNPTVGDCVELRSESFLFDFSGDIYGRKVRVELFEKIRDEICFSSVEELKAQIAKDVERAKSFIRR